MFGNVIVYFCAVVSIASAVSMSLKDAPVENGLCDASVKSYSGYFNVKSGHDKNYFYWFFESRSETQSTDPLIVWLTGGIIFVSIIIIILFISEYIFMIMLYTSIH